MFFSSAIELVSVLGDGVGTVVHGFTEHLRSDPFGRQAVSGFSAITRWNGLRASCQRQAAPARRHYDALSALHLSPDRWVR